MRKIIGVAIAVALLFSTQAAFAGSAPNRKSPPRISLRYKGEVVQRAQPFTYCWGYDNGDGTGTGICADGVPRYPRAAPVDAPARLVLRVHYPAKPEDWFLNAYRAIIRRDGYDETVGDPEGIRFRLRPHRVDGTVRAWDAIFRVEEPLRHYYLDTGGDLAQGDAFYTLHVRT